MPKPKRNEFTDKTPFPWGMHKGVLIGQVPNDYLLWLYKQPWIKDWPDLHNYLVANQKAIMANEAADDANNAADGFTSMDDYEKYK